jgi:hypothetical protein
MEQGRRQEEVGAQALTLEQRVTALENKLKYLTTFIDSSERPLMQVAGANLRIVNGKGSTQTMNELGNLIVGYNEIRNAGNVRTGSHNVIVGRSHNYPHFGGIVAGQQNEILEAFASVSRGFNNTASGPGPQSRGDSPTRPVALAPRLAVAQ